MIVRMNYKYCKGYVILVDPTIHDSLSGFNSPMNFVKSVFPKSF